MQFYKLPKSLAEDTRLNNNDIFVLGVLLDRLQLSKKNHGYSKDGSYFVRFSQKTMAKVARVSERTVSNIYAKLAKLGYIKKRIKQYNSSELIFLKELEKSAGSDQKNLQPNETEFNYTKNTSNTVNTDSRPKKQSISKAELWKQSVIGKIGFSESAVDNIYEFANHDLDRCYQLVKIITNARSSVVREHNLKRSNATDFKTNATIRQRLGTKLRYIFNYLPAQIDEQGKYLTKSLKKFFTETFGIKRDEFTAPQLESKQRPKIDKRMPDWMKVPYDPEKDKVDAASLAETKRMLEEFYLSAQ